MKEYPTSLKELKTEFSTPSQCLDYIANLRWPDGTCRHMCGKEEKELIRYLTKENKPIYKCLHCRRIFHVTAETIFHNTQHKLLPLWFEAIWYITDGYDFTAYTLQKKLQLGSFQTAEKWLYRIKKTMLWYEKQINVTFEKSDSKFYDFMRYSVLTKDITFLIDN